MNVTTKKPIRTVSFRTLGCRLNHSESDSIQYNLAKNGLEILPNSEPSDLTIINSCAVTKQAEAKTRGAIAAARRISPDGKIAVIGCASQLLKEKLFDLHNVDLILGNKEKYNLYEYIDFLENSGKGIFVSEMDGDDTFPNCGTISSGSRTRAFIKIQDGCNFKCSYCIVPYLRGNSRSRKMESCIEEVKLLTDNGYKEIVLSGINIGSYHTGEGKNLCDLIEELLSSTEIPRIRISSIEPNLITDRLLNLIETEERVCRYLHIPLQHGSDEILRLMRRRYNIDEYVSLINKIAYKISGIGIGTDVIVGFPGETEKHFNEMYSLLNSLPLMYFHVFRFSPRYNTPAAELDGKVSEFDKKRRANSLRDLSRAKRVKFLGRFLNEQVDVLFEQKIDSRYVVGYTSNYIKVKSKANEDLINRIAKVEITGIEQENVRGQVIEK